MHLLKHTCYAALLLLLIMTGFLGLVGVNIQPNDIDIVVPRLGTSKKAALKTSVNVTSKGLSVISSDIEILPKNLNKVLKTVLSAPHTDEHGFYLANKSGFTAYLIGVKNLKVSSNSIGLVVRGSVKIRIRKASSSYSNWYSFSMRLGVRTSGSKIIVHRESINVKKVAGWADDKILKNWSLVIDLNDILSCNDADIKIKSLKTFKSGRKAGLKAKLDTPISNLTCLI